MPRKVTIREVANEAGVSVGTASRVINGASNVAENVRRRVEAAIKKLGYKPDPAAQSMRRGATRTVGIMVRDITVPTLASFVREVQDTLYKAGYTLLIACSEDQPQREAEVLRSFVERRVDGVIMTTVSERDPTLLAARGSLEFPIVLLDRELPTAYDSVLLDHYEGTRRAVEFLGSLGHRRVALLTGSLDVYPARERVRAFSDAIARGIIAAAPELICASSFDSSAAFVTASNLFELQEPPTAVVIGGIDMLAGVLRSIRLRNLRIPHDVSIVGAADSDLANLYSPPISVIRWSYAELGRTCARLLLERIESTAKLPQRRIIYPTEFLMRESCGPVPAARREAKH